MAVTVTYSWPVAGIVAPTALQTEDLVVADVLADNNADTDAVITTNMGLSAADLAAGRPAVVIEPLRASAQASLWYVLAKAANSVTITKAPGVGGDAAGAQVRVHITRPHSIYQ